MNVRQRQQPRYQQQQQEPQLPLCVDLDYDDLKALVRIVLDSMSKYRDVEGIDKILCGIITKRPNAFEYPEECGAVPVDYLIDIIDTYINTPNVNRSKDDLCRILRDLLVYRQLIYPQGP
jgi:hypothetical protein